MLKLISNKKNPIKISISFSKSFRSFKGFIKTFGTRDYNLHYKVVKIAENNHLHFVSIFSRHFKRDLKWINSFPKLKKKRFFLAPQFVTPWLERDESSPVKSAIVTPVNPALESRIIYVKHEVGMA